MNKKNLSIKETFALAFQNHKKNKFKIAANFYNKILKVNPNHVESIFLLGSLFAETKNFYDAITLFNKTVQIQPNHESAYYNLGLVFKEIEQFEKSISCYQKAIQINHNYTEAHNNLGLVFVELREFQKASHCFQKAIKIDPNFFKAHNNLGNVKKELGETQEAFTCYEKVIQIRPDHANAYYNLALLSKFLGKFKKAIKYYEKALLYEPKNLVTLYDLIDLKKKIIDSNLKNKIVKIMNSGNFYKKNLAYGNFLLSKYELQLKNYEKEFKYLIKGHQCYFDSQSKRFKQGVNYWLNELPRMHALINANKPDKNIKTINSKITPIFIIGVPRCGSTLIEKIIASGTKYIPIGEETAIFSTLIGQKVHQKELVNLNLENFQKNVIEKYKQKGLILEKSVNIFTDKSLDNFFYIGLINKIFPGAKVINCRRNFLSSIVSIIQNNLREISWAHNLENIFKFFDIYYKKIKNFKKIYPNFIYELEFEKFINNPEIESKKLMKFCELPWNDKCLKYYERKDLVSRTASNVQIRKAIYKNAKNKYLPYKKILNKYGKKYFWFN